MGENIAILQLALVIGPRYPFRTFHWQLNPRVVGAETAGSDRSAAPTPALYELA